MAYHPLNLALRFVLELAALAAFGSYGWRMFDVPTLRFLGALALLLVAAILWGVFAVPADPSRSGNAPVPVPGWARLLLEFHFFGFAAWSLFVSDSPMLGSVLAGAATFHYLASHDRIRWLLARQQSG